MDSLLMIPPSRGIWAFTLEKKKNILACEKISYHLLPSTPTPKNLV